MNVNYKKWDGLSRRSFVKNTARTALGVSILPYANPNEVLAASGGKAEHCIFFYMGGAMSHMETFDPKPGTETGGKTSAIDTGIAGIKFAEYLPNLAKRAKDIAVIRSMTQKTGDHQDARYWLTTSYQPRSTIVHPSMGAWGQRLQGKRLETLPDSVIIGNSNNHPGPGFFGPTYAPLPVADPDVGIDNIGFARGVNEDLFEKRLELMNTFDAGFRSKFQHDEVKSYTQYYDETLKLMQSEDLEQFDLSKEPDYQKKTQRYGNTRVGKGAMLAKRLIKAGVRFVEVGHGGWDMHDELWDRIEGKTNPIDMALSALIDDLKAEGLFDKTVIALATEFGRTPVINVNGGRDHHPRCFSAMLAGGGIQGGQVYGASDEAGNGVKENPVEPKDFNATIAHAMGLDLNKVVYSPTGRPFLIAGHTHDKATDSIVTEGKPIMPLFS